MRLQGFSGTYIDLSALPSEMKGAERVRVKAQWIGVWNHYIRFIYGQTSLSAWAPRSYA